MPHIIFDLNRTLYDPETDTLVQDALPVLQSLHHSGFILHLLSRKGEAHEGRAGLLERHRIATYFSTVDFVDKKDLAAFSRIIWDIGDEEAFVVGDYLKEDIRFGNMAGARTIWFKSGQGAAHVPIDGNEHPWRTVTRLVDILELVIPS